MATYLDTFQDIITEVQRDLNVNDNSSQFPLATVKAAINRAYVNKATRIFKWPQLEDALITSTENGVYYYDAPNSWVADSIFRLVVNDVPYGDKPDYSPSDYNDFLTWKYENPNSTEKKWARQNTRFFMTPTPTSDGTNNICVWGYKTADKLENLTDKTVFSANLPEANEAVVLEAGAILKSKGESDEKSQFLSARAERMLVFANNQISKNKSAEEKLLPFLYVPDYFGGGVSDIKQQITGNF